MADNRPIVYAEEGNWVFRASSVGRSSRELAATMLGYTPLPAPDYLMKAAEAGNRYEGIVRERLVKEHGFELSGDQSVIELTVRAPTDELPGLVIRGHLDGETIEHPYADTSDQWAEFTGNRMLEIKSMSKNVWAKWMMSRFEVFPEYAWQLSCYMQATGKPAVYAVVNRDTDELEVTPVDEMPVPWVEIVAKVLKVDYFNRIGQLPECDSRSQYVCPFEYLCDQRPIFQDELESGNPELLTQLANDYAEIRKLESDLKDRKSAVRDEILIALGDQERVQVGAWSFTRSKSKRKSLDRAALRRELGDRFDEFVTEKEYETLRVTEIGV